MTAPPARSLPAGLEPGHVAAAGRTWHRWYGLQWPWLRDRGRPDPLWWHCLLSAAQVGLAPGDYVPHDVLTAAANLRAVTDGFVLLSHPHVEPAAHPDGPGWWWRVSLHVAAWCPVPDAVGPTTWPPAPTGPMGPPAWPAR